ncbi:hypothetical protein ACFY0A_45405 [Streptomyces sp. NPDC001698]|uniref:hypothetical protein n=1 Tax=Streptomyces sp. NPDC001698 TaxID=3364601 RepID=UPI0036C63FDB
MTAVAVEISPRRPVPDDGPARPEGLPYFTRPVLAAAPKQGDFKFPVGAGCR